MEEKDNYNSGFSYESLLDEKVMFPYPEERLLMMLRPPACPVTPPAAYQGPDPDKGSYYELDKGNGNMEIKVVDYYPGVKPKSWMVDENGNTWKFAGFGSRKDVVVEGDISLYYQKCHDDMMRRRLAGKTWDRWLAIRFRDWFNTCEASEKAWLDKYVQPVAQGAVLLNPIVGLTNDGFIIFGDQDIYGNEASGFDKGAAIFDAATFGMLKGAKYIPRVGKYLPGAIQKGADWGNKRLNWYYSVPNTIYQGYTNEKD